jgi:hypothetical protein
MPPGGAVNSGRLTFNVWCGDTATCIEPIADSDNPISNACLRSYFGQDAALWCASGIAAIPGDPVTGSPQKGRRMNKLAISFP